MADVLEKEAGGRPVAEGLVRELSTASAVRVRPIPSRGKSVTETGNRRGETLESAESDGIQAPANILDGRDIERHMAYRE